MAPGSRDPGTNPDPKATPSANANETTRPALVALPGGRDGAAALGACLVMIHGPAPGRRWDLDRSELFVGRDEAGDVVLPVDTVSRRHCRIAVDGDGVRVRDLGSTNGTFVDEEPVAGETERALRPGQRLRVGGAVLRFLAGADVETLVHEEIHRTRVVDGLTGAGNRRALLEFLELELARHRRHGRPLALLRFDVDDFQRLADDWGLLTADAIVRELGEGLRPQMRRETCFARCDHASFAVALPETGLAEARAFGERLQRWVAEHPFRAHGERLPVGISIGIATAGPQACEPGPLLAAAEAALREIPRGEHRRSTG